MSNGVEMVLPKLVLMAAVMRKCGIPRVRYCPCNGNTQGMLLHEDFWPPRAARPP